MPKYYKVKWDSGTKHTIVFAFDVADAEKFVLDAFGENNYKVYKASQKDITYFKKIRGNRGISETLKSKLGFKK